MSGIVHRYVRRLIAWAAAPSDEEVAQQNALARLARRERLARNARRALIGDHSYEAFYGLRGDDAAMLIEDVRTMAAAEPFITKDAVNRLIGSLTPCLVVPPKGEDKAAA